VPEGTDPTREACPAGTFDEGNILEWWKVSVGRFPNLAQMASDILAGQGDSVGVERVFSMARDVMSYRRSGLKSSTIRTSGPVKCYENDELTKRASRSR